MERIEAYVPDEHAARIRRAAAAGERSVAAELRRAIRVYCHLLDRWEREDGQPLDGAAPATFAAGAAKP